MTGNFRRKTEILRELVTLVQGFMVSDFKKINILHYTYFPVCLNVIMLENQPFLWQIKAYFQVNLQHSLPRPTARENNIKWTAHCTKNCHLELIKK